MSHGLALALALVTAMPAGPQAGAREPRRLEGVAALTLGALAGAAGLGLGLATAPQLAELDACTDCRRRMPPMMFAAVALNTASLGLLAAGSGLRGQALAERDVQRGTVRSAATWISLGGVGVAGGVVLAGAGLTWRFVEPRESATPWALLQVGLSSVVVGSALLVLGVTYRRQVSLATARLRLAPDVGLRHAGLALVGRF